MAIWGEEVPRSSFAAKPCTGSIITIEQQRHYTARALLGFITNGYITVIV